jgi:outer membrane protein OmpA-like peptidoglycan-associated protein
MSEGYFSSRKDSTIDIYHFKTNYQQLFYCENQRINQYCFKFTDEASIPVNENYLQYVWTFGDGSKATGQNVEHCFPGPGKYNVRLDVTDKKSGRVFFSKLSYNLDLRDIEQPIITSPSSAMAGEAIIFGGLKSHFPGTRVLKVTWYFGDGNIKTGESVSHSYKVKGDYEVNMGLILLQEKTGIIFEACGSKQIHVFSDGQEKKSFDAIVPKPVPVTNILSYDHAIIENMYSAGKDLGEDVVYQVEIVNSKTRLNPDNSAFANVPRKFSIKEVRMRTGNLFSYVIAEEMSLMATYSAYNEIVDLGFKNAVIRTFVLEDPAEKELNTLKKVFGVSVDVFFNQNDFSLTSAGTQMLDLILGFMAKYPALKLEIATHTDNTGMPAASMLLSQKRAEAMINYLIVNGVSSLRLIPKGFGGTKPLVPNMYEADRKLNRRVEFTIMRLL